MIFTKTIESKGCEKGEGAGGLLDDGKDMNGRIETLGLPLEADDACGSLRERDYERQLEIRSKQMDCENTLYLRFSSFSPGLLVAIFLFHLPKRRHIEGERKEP